MEVRLPQYENVLSPILGISPRIVTLVRLPQSLKAELPSSVTDAGTVTLVNWSQSYRA